MRIAARPFIAEGIRLYFSHKAILRTYLLLVGVLALVLLLWWPRGAVESMLRTGSAPETFTVIAVGFYFCLLYLGARYGVEGYSPDAPAEMREYATLAPLAHFSIVMGKAAFMLVHTVFLLALGAPFLLAALAVSGVGPVLALDALLVLGASTLAARMCGLLLLALLPRRRLLRDAMYLLGIVLFLVVTGFLAPAANPVAALISLSSRVGTLPATIRVPFGSIPFFSVSVIIDVLAALLLMGGVLAGLGVVRRNARIRNSGQL